MTGSDIVLALNGCHHVFEMSLAILFKQSQSWCRGLSGSYSVLAGDGGGVFYHNDNKTQMTPLGRSTRGSAIANKPFIIGGVKGNNVPSVYDCGLWDSFFWQSDFLSLTPSKAKQSKKL